MLKKILNHSFWLLIGNSIGRLAMFLTSIFAARILPQEVFGQFTTVRSTISMIEGILSGALMSTATKQVAETIHHDQNKLFLLLCSLFFVNVMIAIGIILFLVFFSEWIVNTFFIASSEMVIAFYIGSILLLTTTLSSLTQSILIGFEEFKKMAYIGIAVSTLAIPLIFVLIYYYGLNGAIIGVAIYYLFDFIFKFAFLYSIVQDKKMSFPFSHLLDESKRIISFSFPLFLSIGVNSFAFWYARVIAINDAKGFMHIAIFDASFQWFSIIMLIVGATTSITLSVLSKMQASGNTQEQKSIIAINLAINLGIASFLAIIFSFFSYEIMSIYGKDYAVHSNVLVILSFVIILLTISSLLNKVILVKGNVWMIFFNTFISSLALLGSITFFNDGHAESLAYSFLAFYGVNALMYAFYVIRLNKELV